MHFYYYFEQMESKRVFFAINYALSIHTRNDIGNLVHFGRLVDYRDCNGYDIQLICRNIL